MDKCSLSILDNITEGIVILNDKLEVLFWNKHMENIIKLKKEQVHGISIFKIFPKLDKSYFKNAFNSAIQNTYQYFFSSKIHKNIISDELEINFKINKFENEGKSCLMIEFIDITNQCIRIKQLKEYVKELSLLNKKLQEKEKEIEKLAYYDSLTNVGNRALFYSLSEKLLANSKRNNSMLGLMFIDIDNFKNINDKYGHMIGDKVLIQVANILTESVREADIVARHGGDEFLILLPDLKSYGSYKIIAKRIADANRKIKISEDIELNICLSIGVSFYPKDGATIDELVLKADKAMYGVKKMGGDKCACYTCTNSNNRKAISE